MNSLVEVEETEDYSSFVLFVNDEIRHFKQSVRHRRKMEEVQELSALTEEAEAAEPTEK